MYVLGSNPIHFIILISGLLLIHTHVQAQGPMLTHCRNSANYTSNSQFQTNLNLLLSSLVSNGSRDGFFNDTVGVSPDIVYGLVQCRGDISMDTCRSCLNTSSVEIIQSCPYRKQAALRYEYCMLHYSNIQFSPQVDSSSIIVFVTFGQVLEGDAHIFNQNLGILMNNLSNSAASKPSRFDFGSTQYTDFNNIYGLAQCTRDLSATDCLSCLVSRISSIPGCCNGSIGVQIISTSCALKYETSPFVQISTLSPPPPLQSSPPLESSPPQATTGTGKGKSMTVVTIVVPITVSVLLTGICTYLIYRRIRKNKRKRKPENIYYQDDVRNEESLQFNLNTIRTATNDFSDSNKVGEGGFGAVYKGEFVDGQEIAVKRLSKNSGQGSQEFKNEVVLLHKLQHRNLVRLLGFCLSEEEKLLVYEYVPNRSLDKYLFDLHKKTYLNWETRYKIIGGIARGLLYLHEDSRLRIIHRDLKAGNILLDEEMNAKIADFGMAKLFGVDQTQGNTSRIAGTFGYMAPEYAFKGLFSVKSDVFSFGVLLLEIISGQKTSSFHLSGPSMNLLSYSWKLWREGSALQLIDPCLKDSFSASEVMRCIHIGLLCVQDNSEDRPTMSSVVLMFNSYSLTLHSPAVPAFSSDTTTGENYDLSDAEFKESTSSSLLYAVDGISSLKSNPR